MRFKTGEITSLLHIFESAELKKFVFVLPCWREYFDNSQWGRRKNPVWPWNWQIPDIVSSIPLSSVIFSCCYSFRTVFFFLSQMVQHDVEDTRWKHCVYWAEFTFEYRTVGENILISTLIWVSRCSIHTTAKKCFKAVFFLTWPKIVPSWKLLTL